MDCYEVLGCSRDFTHEEIKRAYHQRLLQFHPDKNVGIDSADPHEYFEVCKAWQILGDPHRKKEYDAKCKQENFEEDEKPVYARLSISDLDAKSSCQDTFYPCRCGSKYVIKQEYLQEKNVLLEIACENCTHVIFVET